VVPTHLSAFSNHLRTFQTDFDIDFEQLDLKTRIGSGTYGNVYKAVWHTGHIWCAVKVLVGVDTADVGLMDDFYREVSIQRDLHHPNLVTCFGACDHPKLAIVTELCLTSLHAVLHEKEGGTPQIAEARLIRMCMGIAAGMAYLHARHIVHRDLKAGNVLLDQYKQVKICDFGISAILDATTKSLDATIGTPQLMAPEVFCQEQYDYKADMYSYGVLIWEMATGKQPWKGVNVLALSKLVAVDNERPPDALDEADRPPPFSARFEQLVTDCWTHAPADRPTFNVVYDRLKHVHCIWESEEQTDPQGQQDKQ
jgi:serine/threonine protein kinase